MLRSLAKYAVYYYVVQAVVGTVIGLYIGFAYPHEVMELINAAY